MLSSFAKRAEEKEIMDDFSLEGELLTHTLDDLRRINKWLGGNQIVISGIERILLAWQPPPDRPIRIADLGCGGGDGLRALAAWGRKKGYSFELTGYDANPAAVAYANDASIDIPELHFEHADVLDPNCQTGDPDIVILGLFLHHLNDDEQIQLIKKCMASGAKAILINDLQRSKIAFGLFILISRIFGFSAMSRHDGALSVRKGFRRSELTSLLTSCGLKSHYLSWKWAFRYQVIALTS